MTTISAETELLTMINTFTVEPDQQQALVQLLQEATEQVIRTLPGFISANLHVSLDGGYVANYAQWRSMADFEAMQANPAVKDHIQRAASLARSFQPIFYRVAFVDGPSQVPTP